MTLIDFIRRGMIESDVSPVTEVQDYRIFASTWNIGGKSPLKGLDLDERLRSPPPADIYVLGFQEIVPLNAGNDIGTEDNVPAKRRMMLKELTLTFFAPDWKIEVRAAGNVFGNYFQVVTEAVLAA
ncbi:hypothetical protein GUJ93_ZPchr0007g5310 [Zizania palustris]|uniref:Inositol polyphosphate-related phosphatase domain-containing protein n=1 Tax=Zizania palustris TaxID=103762 RepID=A0A8J5T7N4_ZIZPA|nr:hypothetical protein GUJ93_ZPchr0007g5310 [Zizania palustris]